jgi:hypothetical protein
MIPSTVYFIINDHGRAGRETVIDWESCSRQDAIYALLSGQYAKPLAVGCIEDMHLRDVSEDIALELIPLAIDRYGLDNDGQIDASCREFIERHASEALDEAEGEIASARPDVAEHSTMHRSMQGV